MANLWFVYLMQPMYSSFGLSENIPNQTPEQRIWEYSGHLLPLKTMQISYIGLIIFARTLQLSVQIFHQVYSEYHEIIPHMKIQYTQPTHTCFILFGLPCTLHDALPPSGGLRKNYSPHAHRSYFTSMMRTPLLLYIHVSRRLSYIGAILTYFSDDAKPHKGNCLLTQF